MSISLCEINIHVQSVPVVRLEADVRLAAPLVRVVPAVTAEAASEDV
jgi:hypothetical protein